MRSKSTIAVIDDDADIREALSALIRSVGWQACCHHSADEFLCAAAHQKADCVITDFQMPGMTGVELLEWIRGQSLSMPVVVVTSHLTEEQRSRVIDAGNARFLGKPFDGEEILRLMESLLG